MSKFNEHVEAMPKLLNDLLTMEPVPATGIPMDAPARGVYLLSENEKHLYVGRSNTLRKRIAQQRRPGSRSNQAAFAMLIAREETGRRSTYKPKGSRDDLAKNDPVFSAAFRRAKERISRMDVRYVEVGDQMKQALFQIYLADALETPYNNWDNH
jgi:hypothetical protein